MLTEGAFYAVNQKGEHMEFLAQLHPVIVHFPIALLTFYVIFEIVTYFLGKPEYEKFVVILLVAGLLAGVFAVLTGNQAEEIAEGKYENSQSVLNYEQIDEAIEEHEEYATKTLWFFVALSVLRIGFIIKKKFDKKIKLIFVLLALVGGYLIYQTGSHGGILVYKYGIGTELMK